MKDILKNSRYQWQYVFIAVLLAFVICGSLIWWKFYNGDDELPVDQSIPITSTTTPMTGKKDIIGKEYSTTSTTGEVLTTKATAKSTTWTLPKLSDADGDNTTDPSDSDDGDRTTTTKDDSQTTSTKPSNTTTTKSDDTEGTTSTTTNP